MPLRIGRRTFAFAGALAALLGLAAATGYGYTRFCGSWVGVGSIAPYWVNPNFRDASAGTPMQQVNQMLAAGNEWNTRGGARFTYEYRGQTAGNALAPGDGRSEIFSLEQANGAALAVTVCDGTSVSAGADVLFYDQGWTWRIDGQDLDIRTVALHEMGHLLGLGHTSVTNQVMLPNYRGVDRDLGADDIAGIQAIYGPKLIPDVQIVLPPVGPVRGGTQVRVLGVNFGPGAQVTFDGIPASVVSRTGMTEIVAITPPGSEVGRFADVTVTQQDGSDTLTAGYEYQENPTSLEWTGTPGVGQPITITVYGPPNLRAGLVVGAPGFLERGGYTWCFGPPFALKVTPRNLNTGPRGEASVTWTVVGEVGQRFHAQAALLSDVGPVQVNCTGIDVVP